MYFNHNYTISFDVGIYVNCESTGIVRLKIKMRFIIRVDKLGNRESAIKIHDVACTPNCRYVQLYINTSNEIVEL